MLCDLKLSYLSVKQTKLNGKGKQCKQKNILLVIYRFVAFIYNFTKKKQKKKESN